MGGDVGTIGGRQFNSAYATDQTQADGFSLALHRAEMGDRSKRAENASKHEAKAGARTKAHPAPVTKTHVERVRQPNFRRLHKSTDGAKSAADHYHRAAAFWGGLRPEHVRKLHEEAEQAVAVIPVQVDTELRSASVDSTDSDAAAHAYLLKAPQLETANGGHLLEPAG